ncbi:hypothetical protein [Streptomyces sp. NPDC058086]
MMRRKLNVRRATYVHFSLFAGLAAATAAHAATERAAREARKEARRNDA